MRSEIIETGVYSRFAGARFCFSLQLVDQPGGLGPELT